MTAHWGTPNPAAVQGAPEELASDFQDAFSIVERRINFFLSVPLFSLESLAIERGLDRIGKQ